MKKSTLVWVHGSLRLRYRDFSEFSKGEQTDFFDRNQLEINRNHGKSTEITRNHGNQQKSTEIMGNHGNHGKSREITGNHEKSSEINIHYSYYIYLNFIDLFDIESKIRKIPHFYPVFVNSVVQRVMDV